MTPGTAATTAFFGLAFLLTAGAGALALGRLLRPDRADDRALDAAISLGPVAGLLVAAFPGWLLSGLFRVPVDAVVLPAGTLALLAVAGWGRREAPRLLGRPRALLLPLAVPLLAFAAFLWLRGPFAAIRQTEKPMDLAVLSGLLSTTHLPFGDPWMAGERFPYYHFGTFLFSLPARLAGLAPGLAYNLVAALLPALAAAAAFAAVRLKGGSRLLAASAAFVLVLAGTFDGARQLLGGAHLADVDFWASSRRVAGAITEWPLFTFRLGDLHPHALAIPVLLSLAAVAGAVRGFPGRLLEGVVLAGLVTANPWDLPAALLVLAAGHLAATPPLRALRDAAASVAVAVPLLLPALLGPRPQFLGVGAAGGSTASWEAFLHLGGFLVVPALSVGVALVRSASAPEEKLFFAAVFPAAGIGLAVVTGKPVLGLALAFVGAVEAVRPRLSPALAQGFLLAAAAASLAAVPEVVVVLDPYGADLRRMNTIFKTWSAAVPLLVVASALLLPLALSTRRARRTIRLLLAVAAVGLLAHPAAAVLSRLRDSAASLDGLSGMTAGDLAAVRWLRAHSPAGAVVAEAPGAQYGEEGRIGAAAGRPVVLGWAGHERLWRGAAGAAAVDRREADLQAIYRSADPVAVDAALARRKVSFVAVGGVERKAFGKDAFPARVRFTAVVDEGGTALYRVSAGDAPAPPR